MAIAGSKILFQKTLKATKKLAMTTALETYQKYKTNCPEKILDLLIKESRFGKDDLLQETIRDNVMTEIVKTKRFDLISDFVSLMDASILLYQSIHQPLFEVKDVQVLHHLALKLCQFPELIPIFFQSNRFPILDELVQFVHLEGEKGEQARVAFELLVKLEPLEIQEYIAKSEFCGIVIASLCGLYCQLPETIGKVVDLKAFVSFYEFVQSCITHSKGVTQASLLQQFQTLFLDQVVQSGIQSASDFDGSTNAWIFYTRTMIDLTHDTNMLQAITISLFKESDDGDELNSRDILLSKLTSLSEVVVVGVLQLISTVIKKWDGAIFVLFRGLEKQDEMHIEVGDHVQIVEKWMHVCSNKQGLESYVSDAIFQMEEFAKRRTTVTIEDDNGQLEKEQGNNYDQLETLQSCSLWTKLHDKLQTFFSQSMAINLALTGLLRTIAIEPHPVVYKLFFYSEKNVYDHVQVLCREIPQNGSGRIRMELIKKDVERGTAVVGTTQGEGRVVEEWNQEREIVKNCVVLEEFVKEIVGCLLMRGSTCREHISYM
jgi:hypothetical protein